MREPVAYGGIIAALVLVTALYPSAGWIIRKAFSTQSDTDRQYQELQRRVQVLEAERATLAPIGMRAERASGTLAFVFSRYPFNFKNELLVSEGKNAAVMEGDLALADGVFVGKVHAVYAESASVTIFDTSFESAVRIGSGAVDALLLGGGTPTVTLIPRRAEVKEGDIVYTASPDVPYGIALGTVLQIAPSRDNIFREATLAFAYDINHITSLRIIPSPARGPASPARGR